MSLVGLATAALLLWGGYAAFNMPLDAIPDLFDHETATALNEHELTPETIKSLVAETEFRSDVTPNEFGESLKGTPLPAREKPGKLPECQRTDDDPERLLAGPDFLAECCTAAQRPGLRKPRSARPPPRARVIATAAAAPARSESSRASFRSPAPAQTVAARAR